MLKELGTRNFRVPNSLINQVILFCSEARKTCTIAVTPLGYDFVNFNLWS